MKKQCRQISIGVRTTHLLVLNLVAFLMDKLDYRHRKKRRQNEKEDQDLKENFILWLFFFLENLHKI